MVLPEGFETHYDAFSKEHYFGPKVKTLQEKEY